MFSSGCHLISSFIQGVGSVAPRVPLIRRFYLLPRGRSTGAWSLPTQVLCIRVSGWWLARLSPFLQGHPCASLGIMALTQPFFLYLGIGVVACPATIFSSRAPMIDGGQWQQIMIYADLYLSGWVFVFAVYLLRVPHLRR